MHARRNGYALVAEMRRSAFELSFLFVQTLLAGTRSSACATAAMLTVLLSALESGGDICNPSFATSLDAAGASASLPAARGLREAFHIPRTMPGARYRAPGDSEVYLCGHSLGLAPRRTALAVGKELAVWAARGVEGHFEAGLPADEAVDDGCKSAGASSVWPGGRWAEIEDSVVAGSAALVGASPHEVAVMGTLTANLHALMAPFYRPAGERGAILMEARAFPSDAHAMASQLALHGRRSDELILLAPRPGEALLREADVLEAIASAGKRLALVLWPGVQYYTGQAFNLAAFAAAAHAVGAVFGADLAHAVGNVPLSLHDDGVDFAAWCTYKYGNAGPGAVGGLFVHARWADMLSAERGHPHLAGWWGSDRAGRFRMATDFLPAGPGPAARLQLSNPGVLGVVSLRASLDTYAEAGGWADDARDVASNAPLAVTAACQAAAIAASLPLLRERAIALTLFLEALLVEECGAVIGAAAGSVGDDDELAQPHPVLATRWAAARARPRPCQFIGASAKTTPSEVALDGARAALLADSLTLAPATPAMMPAPNNPRTADGVADGPALRAPTLPATAPTLPAIRIITPAATRSRGCQLSLAFAQPARAVAARLAREGVIVDLREPDVIRLAPVPLYNTAADVLEFVTTLKLVLAEGEELASAVPLEV